MSNIFTKDKYIELNTIINRIDMEKDAFNPQININSENGNKLFQYCADQMFGNLDKYSKQLRHIENTINNYKEGKINIYNSYDNNYVNFLSPNIIYGIYDTGVNPRSINKDIKIINTPASYIDSADKIKYNEESCFSDILTCDIFKTLGINNVKEIKNINMGNRMITTIIFNFHKNINKSFTFSKITNDIKSRPEYFKGNATKNEWFNNNYLKTIINRKEYYRIEVINNAKTYLLCKLLGDLLQAYYCKLYLDKLPKEERNACCIFTLDNILRLRSILLNIPVLYNRGINMNTLETKYYTSDSSINTHFKSLYYDIMKNHNNSIIENINNIINIGYFYINKDKVLINPKIQNILITLIKYINSKTLFAKTIENPILEEYRKEICNYMGRHIFHKMNMETIYICYTEIYSLFPGLDQETDIIAKTKNTISNIFLSLNTQKGGGSKESLEYTIGYDYSFGYDVQTDEEYDKKIKELLLENPGEAVKFSLYYIVSKYDFENDFDKYEMIYNTYNILFNFYTYSGKTIVHSEFLEKVFELYINEKLSKIKPADFDKVIEDWIKTQPNEEELEAKRIDEWGKKFDYKEEKKRKRNGLANNTRKRGRVSIFSPLIPRIQNKTRRIVRGRGGRRDTL